MDYTTFDDGDLRGYLRGQLEKKRTLEVELELTVKRISEATTELQGRREAATTNDAQDWRGLALR